MCGIYRDLLGGHHTSRLSPALDRPSDMGKVLILLALGLAAADNLDRSYLPPPGAKLAGGNPDDLQTPLELPKRTFDDISSTTVQDKEVLRSGFVDGSTIGPISGTTSDSMSSQTLYTVSSPVTSYTYYPSTVFQESDYGTTKRPLDINQEDANNYSSLENPNINNFVPNIQSTGNIPSIYQDVGSTYQYPSLNVPYFDVKLKPVGPSNTRPYLKQDKEKPVFSSQESNRQNLGTIEGSAAIYETNERGITDPLIEMIQYLGNKFMPDTNNYQTKGNIDTIQYTPSAVIMDEAVNAYTNPESLHFDSTIPISKLKSILSSLEPIEPSSSVKFEPFSSIRNTGIASDSIKPPPERPQAEADRNAVVLNYQNVITPKGYSYAYNTSNGISANESGTANDGVRAQGAYSYTGDDGKVYRVVYTADENGFLPRGDHLPRVPEAIQRLIEKAAREKEAGIVDDGSYDEAKYGHKNYEGVMERYNPEYQGFMNTMDPYRYVSRKQNIGEGIRKLLKIIPKSTQHKDNGNDNDYGTYRPSGNVHKQGDNHVIQSKLKGETDKQLGNSLSQISLNEFTDEGIDNKDLDVLFNDGLNINSLGNQGVTKIQEPGILTNQGKDLQKGGIAFGIPSEYSKQNIPEIVQNSNPDYSNFDVVDKQDGYFYITPQNKFIEHKNQLTNKGSNPFNIDQELDIGDDDIISISVPSPNTFTSSENEAIQTDSSYKNPYTIGKISSIKNNENLGVNEPENSNVSPYNLDSTTVPIDYSSQPKQLSDPTSKIEYGVPINPADGKQTKSINISRLPTLQGYGTLSMVDGFGKPITAVSYKYQENLSMIPKFYGQNPNMRLSDMDVGNTDISDFKKGDESELSNERDFENDYFETLKSKSDQNSDKIFGITAKTVIGEDFSGPKRAQTFEPQTGYFY